MTSSKKPATRLDSIPMPPGPTEIVASSPGDRKMEQIRDILFGGLAREYDRRFQELEERLSHEVARADRELERRVTSLTDQMNATCERLTSQLRQEIGARSAALDDIDARWGQAMRTQRTELNAGLERVEQELSQSESRTREALLQLETDVMAALQALRDMLAGEREQMRRDKLGRADLADMMSELSMRLRGTLELPDLG